MHYTEAYFLLGSNLGDRVLLLQQARALLQQKTGAIVRQSAIYETAAWGFTDQPAFLNQVVVIQTNLHPTELLKQIRYTEEALGRVRYEKWGSRLIDVDLLYYGDLAMQSPDLVVPHPFIQERRFTLVPLVEVAPGLMHPLLRLTNQQLLTACSDNSQVVRFEE
ncbi:MAG: 2-amino-4-hydroxy-6-hydroxymethyldihydropteridine diphosphokinase [Spirosomataceae bacterium]